MIAAALMSACACARGSAPRTDGTASPLRLPKGWLNISLGVCGGGSIAQGGPGCTLLPQFPLECAYPATRSGWPGLGSWAAHECTNWSRCKAITCGPISSAVSAVAVEWCFARDQFASTCSVPGYFSLGPFAPPAAFRLASIYGSHMVLQRAPASAVLWGYATAGSLVRASVSPSTHGHVHLPGVGMAPWPRTASTTADATTGVWQLPLPPISTTCAHAPCSYTVTCSSSLDTSTTLTLTDILFGEVWLMSGQSNAAFTLGMQASGGGPLAANASAEISGSANYASAIRVFNTGVVESGVPQQELSPVLPWSRPSPNALAGADVMGHTGFTATGW